MKIVDLAEEHKSLFAVCLEDWSPDAAEAGPKRAEWISRFEKKGLRAKIALDDDTRVIADIGHVIFFGQMVHPGRKVVSKITDSLDYPFLAITVFMIFLGTMFGIILATIRDSLGGSNKEHSPELREDNRESVIGIKS